MSHPLRILVIAEACNPNWTSVPLVGYNMTRALAARADLKLTIVTHVRNRAALSSDPLTRLAEVHFLDTEWLAKPLHRLSRWLRGGDGLGWTIDTALAWPSYIAFEHEVFRKFGTRLDRGEFDLIHRVTPLSPTIGSPLAGMTDVPMVIGPLNGGLPWPQQYPNLRAREKEWLAPFRAAYRSLPWHASTYRRLKGVIAGSRHTAHEVPRTYRGQRFYLPENGVDPERFPIADGWPERRGRFRFITVGRLVPYKGMDLILEALHGSPGLANAELVVLGDGPERGRLEVLTREFGLAERVRFLGWVDQRSLGGELRAAQAFVFPSLREFGGGVVLEALASGLPAIVVDYGGPGELVDPDCGILLPMLPRDKLVPLLQEAMERLSGNPDSCRQLGRRACEKVRDHYVWPAKAGKVVEVYRQVLASQHGSGRSLGVGPRSPTVLAVRSGGGS